jgi:ribosomal protein S18 acetylase RimI-like enzyme
MGGPEHVGEQEPDAGYVHRLAVRRAYAGRGMGRALLEWAAAQTAGSGRVWLRLDCMADNRRLCHYYESLGFVQRGIVGNDRWSGRLYEQRAASLL